MDRHQHPTNNGVLGAPPGMPIEECHALPITRIRYACGTPAVVSYWMPTEREISLLLAGRPVRLCVLGALTPPVMLGVDGDGLL